jgi:2,4-dienoyl-CoA reductase-like NADH-dependent reductase (Old Yellow Enzyme family)/thioredoxin reductase
MGTRFKRLFEPGYIGEMKLQNRIVKLPTRTGYATRDGAVSERLLRHYKEIAFGGAGLVIVGAACVDNKASATGPACLFASDMSFMYGLSLLAQTIHENGAKSALQINHGGAQRKMGPPIKGMSRILYEDHFAEQGVAGLPEELTAEEIAEIVEAFGDSALRAKNAGFDMVEVHGAHGYLITQSLSPYMNKRQDMYGGSLENRMRFLLEIVNNIRKKVETDFPIGVRLSATEYIDGGIAFEETVEVVKALETLGVNVISISSGCRQSEDKFVIPTYHPSAFNVWAAEELKKLTRMPIICGGAINTPALAEQILEEGKADFIGLARPLIADPHFPRKAKEGRIEDIVPCIRDNEGCWNLKRRGWGGMLCTVNVAVGKEDEFSIAPAAKPKKVAVIGGGPAGMEAARVAALAGHSVTLFEKRELGGHLIEGSVPEFKADIRRLIEYFETQLNKLGVAIVKKEAHADDIQQGTFDTVIVATGSKPIVPQMPGVNRPLVVGGLEVHKKKNQLGKNVIVVGGGSVGCDVALFLAEQGKKVTLIEMLDKIAPDMEPKAERKAFLEKLGKSCIKTMVKTKVVEIVDTGVVVLDAGGKYGKVEADNVVLAVGLTPTSWPDMGKLLKDAKIEICEVGDCVRPRKIFDAIHEGHLAARRL